jgi:hypothetical protein
METMLNPDENYPFDKIEIKTPKALQGGTYCANLELENKPIIIQTPKCKTKNGIHKTAKHIYCDLLMNRDNQKFIDWLDKFQERIRELILENSSKWFHESPTMDEIEYNWNNSSRIYKTSNYLVRSFVHKTKGINKISLQIFDTDENQLDIDDVDNEKKVICILEIIGLKFSSNSFHLEICLRQMMVINEKPIFNKCLIKFNNKIQKEENLEKDITSNIVDNVDDNKISLMDIEETEVKEEKETDDEPKAEKSKKVTIDDNVVEAVLGESMENENNTEEQEKNNLEDTKITESIENNQNESKDIPSLEKNNDLEEIELFIGEEEPIKLKEPSEVYLDIYKQAREKAKKAKNEAIKAYLEAKRIKELYMLDVADSTDSDESEEEEEELFSEN